MDIAYNDKGQRLWKTEYQDVLGEQVTNKTLYVYDATGTLVYNTTRTSSNGGVFEDYEI